VNRTDRLYALVEELRACAPRRRSARELALLYEVSARTIERDIGALQQAGVPIYADAGRSGGYTVDKSLTLPPLNFSPAEAVAVAVALGRVNVGPFEGAAWALIGGREVGHGTAGCATRCTSMISSPRPTIRPISPERAAGSGNSARRVVVSGLVVTSQSSNCARSVLPAWPLKVIS
jgi:biotin operon repressor